MNNLVAYAAAGALLSLGSFVPAQTKPYLYGLEGFGPTSLLRMDPATGSRLQAMPAATTYSFALARDGVSLLSTDFTTNEVVRIDPFTGQRTVLGPMTAFNFRGLEVDPTNSNAYLATDVFCCTNTLYRVDKNTGGMIAIGPIAIAGTQVTALAINSLGSAFIVSGGFGTSIVLHQINLANASITTVGPITGLPAQSRLDDLAFDQNNLLHAVHRPSGGVYTVDTTTLAATFLFDTGNLTSIAFLTTCPGQAASSSNYGSGWPGTNGVPALSASNPPRLGDSVSVLLGSSLNVPTQGALFFGIAPASLPTPFGGTLLVSILTSINLSVPTAGAILPLALPNLPSACGQQVYFQGVELDAGASLGISFTRGLLLTLGS